jgi:protein-L-isoaspartate O-methyltransferase
MTTDNNVNQFFSWVTDIFYSHISPKFDTGSFKNVMDYSYAFFEKIAVHFPVFWLLYIDMYKELVDKEIQSLNISFNDSVLVVGCGSIAATSFLIAQHSNAKKIVSIDYDAKAIQNAKNLISYVQCDTILDFEYADGLSYDVKGFDVVFVLYGIKKQKEILTHLYQNIDNCSRIIFRTTNDSLTQFVGGKQFLEQYFEIKKTIQSDTLFDTVSFLLQKNTK